MVPVKYFGSSYLGGSVSVFSPFVWLRPFCFYCQSQFGFYQPAWLLSFILIILAFAFVHFFAFFSTLSEPIMSDPESTRASQDGGNSNTVHQSSYEPACDECRVRKVKCNKEYPKCSNCQKSNLPCGFSNKGKRVNHTKRLYVFYFFC